MKKSIQTIISMEVASRIESLISTHDDEKSPFIMGDEEIIRRLHTIEMSLLNHEETVKQNRQLQTRLNEAEKELKDLKEKPFFPYELNSGNRMDFGAFVLISHAWFSFLNTKFQVGIVEVEYKNDGRRVMYVGITNPVPSLAGFKDSVIEIAAYGQKIKDSAEV